MNTILYSHDDEAILIYLTTTDEAERQKLRAEAMRKLKYNSSIIDTTINTFDNTYGNE